MVTAENKDFLKYETTFSWYFRSFFSKLMLVVTGLCLIIVCIPVFSILIQVFSNGIRSLHINEVGLADLKLYLTTAGGSPLSHNVGINHALMGTLYVTLFASMMGIPFGIIIGIYLAYFGKGILNDILRIGIDTMVSIPTIITGVVVWVLVVKAMGQFSVLAGSIALAFIMIPIIAKTTEEMIRLVPTMYDEVGYSLGLNESRIAVSIVLPIASKGIASGVLLAFARILGETAPLLFTAFFSQFVPADITQSTATLTVLIYQYAISPFDHWQELAWFAAMLLIFINISIVVLTRVIFRDDYSNR